MTAPTPIPDPVTVADLWDLRADPAAVDAAARSWRRYADALERARRAVDEPADRLRGDAWRGTTAESFHAHRLRLGTDLDETARIAATISGCLAEVAGWLTAGQQLLDQLRAEITARVPVATAGDLLVFRPRTLVEAAAVEQAVDEARAARQRYESELLRNAAVLDRARAGLADAARSWTAVAGGRSDGWSLPAEATDGTTVLRVGDQLVINTGSGDDVVAVTFDKVTGDHLVNVNGMTLRHPAGLRLVLRTGPGNDQIIVAPGTRIDLTVLAGEGDDRVATGDGRDVVLGHHGRDRISTGGGADRISGGAGRDYLDGGAGDDVLTGGEGDDTLYGLGGADRLSGGAGRDHLEGGAGDDRLDGGGDNDTISGGRGDDTIRAGAGADTVYTGGGADRVDGGSGVSSVGGVAAGDTVYRAAGATVTDVERVVTVELRDLGRQIVVEGSPAFRERVEADLDLLRASPCGQRMLAALEAAHRDSRTGVADWPLLGRLTDQGDTITIRELHEENGYAIRNEVTLFGRTLIRRPEIRYNPSFDDLYDGPPVVVLQHELAHIYAYRYTRPGDAPGDGEHAVIGLPVDHDGDPRSPEVIDPRHPFEYTENALREELGAPPRPAY